MPYRPNIIPQCSPGFLSSITNSLSFLTLGAGGTAGNSKSVSAGGNLAELRCEMVRLCELQEMPGCSVGGLAWLGPASLGGQAERRLGGSFVSQSNLDFVPCCWWASAPWNRLFAFTGSFLKGFGGAEVCPGGATQALGVLPCPVWGFRHWAHRAEPLASEMFVWA